jgi:hypothetical protein
MVDLVAQTLETAWNERLAELQAARVEDRTRRKIWGLIVCCSQVVRHAATMYRQIQAGGVVEWRERSKFVVTVEVRCTVGIGANERGTRVDAVTLNHRGGVGPIVAGVPPDMQRSLRAARSLRGAICSAHLAGP